MRSAGSTALNRVETIGNRLPEPAAIFAAGLLILCFVSAAVAWAEWSAVHPVSGEVLRASSLLSLENVRRLILHMPETVANFPPLMQILIMTIGVSVAQGSGMLAALVRVVGARVGARFLSPAFFIMALLAHPMGDASLLVLPALAGAAFLSVGRHPLAGVAIAYCGISGALAANFFPGPLDVILLSMSESGARMIDPEAVVGPLGNWWFTLAAAAIFLPIAWLLTDRFLEPRLAARHPLAARADWDENMVEPKGAEGRALLGAAVVAAAVAALLVTVLLWRDGQAVDGLRSNEAMSKSLVTILMLLFLAGGWMFGRATGTIKSSADLIEMMADGFRSLAPFIVVSVLAAHLVAMFMWSNVGPLIAINGATQLAQLEADPMLLLIGLVLAAALVDVVMPSASAKWAALATVAVPMLMLLGVSPEATTAAYRVGDSVVNIVSPFSASFILVLIVCRRWSPRFGVGSLIAMMLPYSASFGLAGIGLIAVASIFKLPIGPYATFGVQ